MNSFELKEPNEYKKLTPIIHKINREVIALKEHEKKKAVEVMNKVVRHVVEKLKSVNKTFAAVYKDTREVGSYFDGLRVNEPTEFDVNLVLQFPFHQKCELEKATPGFVKVCVDRSSHVILESRTTQWNRRPMDWTLKEMVDDCGFLRRDKVLAWWQSMFSAAVRSEDIVRLTGDDHYYSVTWYTSGPAITLHVVSLGQVFSPIDIDLVPVLRFKDDDAPPPSDVLDEWLKKTDFPYPPKEWYIVPKPLRTDKTNRLWRLSFTDQEKVIMRGKDHLKPVNKLLKRLRDHHQWKRLSSYFIKTVCIHESCRDMTFHRNNLGYLLIFFMARLKDRLDNQYLPFYWDPGMNLFSEINKETLVNMSGFLNRTLKKIHGLLDDPVELEEFLGDLFIGEKDLRCNSSLRSNSFGPVHQQIAGESGSSGVGIGLGTVLFGAVVAFGAVAAMFIAGNRRRQN